MNSKQSENIGDLIQQLAKDDSEEVYSEECKVVAVNDNSVVDVEPLSGKAKIFDVKLVSGKDETNFVIVPELNSIVTITYTSKDTAFVSCFSKVKEVLIRGDQHGGLIKIDELVKKMNRIEDKLNGLISKHNSHIHITTATISASAVPGVLSPTTSQEVAIAPNTQKSDLENPKIKHG